jgi:hypothetical protein
MELQVRLVAFEGDRVHLMLCDGAGVPLPSQEAVSLDDDAGDDARVTVTFVVDGDRVRLVP